MPKKPRKPKGPAPERLKIDGNWIKAVKTALKRGKPKESPKRGK